MVFQTILWFAIFGVSLTVLIKASDFFTDSAEKIGLMLGVSPFIIGVTIVSIGTSLPELITSLVAVADKAPEIVAGNVIGSNIANIFLILGFGAIIGKELKIKFNLMSIDVPILIGSAFLLALLMWDGFVSRIEALILIAGFFIYMFYTVSREAKENQHPGEGEEAVIKPPFSIKPVIVVIISAGCIFLGAKFTVLSVIELSKIFNIGKEIISVTVVALGTSLPELVVTISAVRKKNAEMVIGNVLGSNIFNTFAVTGFPAVISGLVVPVSLIQLSIPVFLCATIVFFAAVLDKRITRWEGWIFMLFYVFFIGKTFGLL